MFLSLRRLGTPRPPVSLGQRVTGGFHSGWRLVSDRQFSRKKLEEWKAIAVHTWESLKTGSKLFSKNVSISRNLMLKRAKGHGLTLQEHKLLLRTFSDTLKLVPFSFFIIVPFAELLLPFALWAFPNMLPSTFKDIISDNSWRVRRLRAKKEMAGFFEEALRERAERERSSEEERETFAQKQSELKELQELMVAYGNGKKAFPEAPELLKFARLFREEFHLENMQLDHLKAICRLLGLSDRGFHTHVVLQLRHYLLKLLREDKEIRWEGVDSLSGEDLREACRARGMIEAEEDGKTRPVSEKEMRAMLDHWLQLSSVKDMPLTLLLWSRVYAQSGERELLDIHPTDAVLSPPAAEEESARVLKYKTRVETLLRQLKELEELEAQTFAQQTQVIEGGVTQFASKEQEQEQAGTGDERERQARRIARLEEELQSKRRLIDMQNAFLKQQIELIAKLREMPGLSLAGRGRQSKELRAELKKMYDQFDQELKSVEEAMRQNR